MFVLISILAIFVALFWYVVIKPMSFWKEKGVNQPAPSQIFLGTLKVILRPENAVDLGIRTYMHSAKVRYFGMYQITRPALFIRDPELIKQLAVKDADYFTDHFTFIPETADLLWGKSLFTLKGQAWREMRQIISPTFTGSKLRSMFVLIEDCVEQFVNHFLAKNEDTIDVEMKDIFTHYGCDVVASIAFGFKINCLAEPNNKFYLAGKTLTDFSGIGKILKISGNVIAPKLCKILKIRLIDDDTTNYFIDIVNETIRIREEQGIVRPDMIHLLLEARKGNNKHDENEVPDTGFAVIREADNGKAEITTKHKEITNLDIAAQSFGFFFAGYESVTSLMTFMAYELAVNTDIQDRLRDEIKETRQKCDGKVTYEALLKMKYMDMVLSETLRKWPNLVALERVCTKPYTIQPKYADEKPVHLKIGNGIYLPVIGLHYNPKYFPEPMKFDPERFSDENKSKITPYTLFPFGVGPRSCLGSKLSQMEIKALFFNLLYHFEIVPTEKTQIPLKLAKKSIVMAIEGGLNVALKRTRNP